MHLLTPALSASQTRALPQDQELRQYGHVGDGSHQSADMIRGSADPEDSDESLAAASSSESSLAPREEWPPKRRSKQDKQQPKEEDDDDDDDDDDPDEEEEEQETKQKYREDVSELDVAGLC